MVMVMVILILIAQGPKSQMGRIHLRCLGIEGYQLPTPLHLKMAEGSVKSRSTVVNWKDSLVPSYSPGEAIKEAMEGLAGHYLPTLSCSQSPKSEERNHPSDTASHSWRERKGCESTPQHN